MKKSNKLLLGGFLTVILLITSINVILFAKYKTGNYTIFRPEDERDNNRMQSFPGVTSVVIKNVSGAVVQFGPTAQVEKNNDDLIKYVQQGDSLIISGHTRDAPYGNRLIIVTLPRNVTLSANNSLLHFNRGKQDSGLSPVIYLQKSHAEFNKGAASVPFGNVKIIATDSSKALFQGKTTMNHLEAQLSNSTLEYNEGDVGELSIVTDSLSRLSLQSKLLLKAKITTVSNNP